MNTEELKERLKELAREITEAEDVALVYFVAGELEKIAEEITDRYEEGVSDTLSELRDVYGEGLEETDLWKEHNDKEEGGN